MEIIILLLICSSIATHGIALPQTRGPIEEMLDRKVEEFRTLMRQCDPESAVPCMAPFEHDGFSINDRNFLGLMSATGDLKNIRISNMDDFVKHELTFSLASLRSDFNFTMPDLVAEGNEDLYGKLFRLLPWWGYGKFFFNPINVHLSGEARFSLAILSGKLKLKSLEAEMVMESLNCRFDNLITGGDFSDLMNCVIEDMIPSALDNFKERVSEKVVAIMTPLIEKVLENVTIRG